MGLKLTVMITTNEQFHRLAKSAGFTSDGGTIQVTSDLDTELYYFYLLMLKEVATLLNLAADQNEKLANSPEAAFNIIEKAVLMGAQKQSLKTIDNLITHFGITD